MPKDGNHVETKVTKAKWEGFANVKLPPHTSLEHIVDALDAIDVIDALEGLLESGYKVSVSKDWNSGSRIVSITGQYDFCQNAGLTCSTWASTVDAGIFASLWKALHANGDGAWENRQVGSAVEI